MTNKQEAIRFYQWVQRQHYIGFPKVAIEPREYNGRTITERNMTTEELYDHFDRLPEIQKNTIFK